MSSYRRWTIGIIVSLVMSLMIYRLFTKHVRGVNEEKLTFLGELKYDFFAEIDSVIDANHIMFHVRHGHLDKNRERQLGEKLKYWGELILFRYQGDKIEMMVGPSACQTGDSLYVNTDKNIVRIYLKEGGIKEYPLTGLLRGRPF